MTNAIAAFGTLLKIGDGGGPETFTTIAEVTDIDGPKMSLDTADATHHSSPGGWKEYVPTLLDGGEVAFTVNFIPSNATQSYSSGVLRDMANKNKRNFKLVFPDAGNTTWTFSAFVTGFEPKEALKDQLTADITLQITGQPILV